MGNVNRVYNQTILSLLIPNALKYVEMEIVLPISFNVMTVI